MTRYLILGGSAGAIGAVEAIREIDKEGEITIVSQEDIAAYSRPMISEYLARKAELDEMYYRPLSFYDEHRVRLILGQRAKTINRDERWVELESWERIPYDRLLLATGGVPVLPPIIGADKQGVYTFTTIGDARAIDEAIEGGAAVATVIGGGLIGVSVTEALVKRGLHVVLIELQDRLLSLSLDKYTSELATNALVNAGVVLITGHSVAAVTGRPATPNLVGGVVLDDGRHIPSDLVVMAVGVRPNLDLARSAGLDVNRGIIVNSRMQTSASDVYACGDVAEAPTMDGDRRVVPLWPLAYIGGRTAGINMAGGTHDYMGGVNISTLKYFRMRVMTAGQVDANGADDVEVLVNHSGPIYRKVVVKNDRLIGMVFANDIERSGLVFGLMREGVDVGGFKQSLVADSFGLVALPTSLRRRLLAVVDAGSEII